MTDRDLANRALEAQHPLTQLSERNSWWAAALDNLIRLPDHMRQTATPGIRGLASEAKTYALNAEMTDLVENASTGLARGWMNGDTDPEVLLPYDVPSGNGFVLFDHHVQLKVPSAVGVKAHTEHVIGFLWEAGGPGIAVFPLAGRDYWQAMYDSIEGPKADLTTPPLVMPFDYAGWHFNVPWLVDPNVPMGSGGKTVEKDGKSYRAFSPAGAADRVILFSFFRLVQQKIPYVERAHPGRQEVRRIERSHPGFAAKALDDGAVRILTLRRERPANDDEAGADIVWSHRWMVDGHWARRRVATRDEHGRIIGNVQGEQDVDWTYRRVYIAPFVKGPEGAPLVVRDTVRLLKR